MENTVRTSQQLVEEFVSRASLESSIFSLKEIDEQRVIAERFLVARKDDVQRAVRLYLANEKLRQEEGLESIDPCREQIREELLSGKFTILTQPDHRTGAIVAIFTLRLHWPDLSHEKDTLQGLVLQLDAAMQSESARRNGVILIYDMHGCKVANFDYKLSTKIVRMLQGSYPARLRSVFIVTAPLWFRAPFKLLRLFLREKLRQRVFTITCRNDLAKYLSNLPPEFGGNEWHSHREWLRNHVLLHTIRLLPEDYFSRPLTTQPHSSTEMSQNESNATNETCSFTNNDIMCGSFTQMSSSDLANEDTPTIIRKPIIDSSTLSGADSTAQQSPVGSYSDDNSLQEPCSPAYSVGDESSTCSLTASWDSEALNGLGDSDSITSLKKSYHGVSVHQSDDFDGGVDLVGFLEHIRMMDGSFGLMREFTSQIRMRDEVLYSHTSYPSFERNPHRNRYLNVPCIESTRVVLHLMENSDYVHANWVDGYQQRNAFICAQGPMTSTIVEFWSMIWEYYVPVIVMTTRPWEQRVDKCAIYWPEEEGKSSSPLLVNSDIHLVIRNDKVQHTPDFKVSTLIVENTLTGECRKVVHLYFTAWADHSAPESADAFLDLLEAYRSHYDAALQELGYPPVWQAITSGCAGFGSLHSSYSKSSGSAMTSQTSLSTTVDHRSDNILRSIDIPPPPTVVHCSAGIGRTGTFVAMDVNTKRLEHMGRVNLLSSIQLMRTQRRGSVQTDQQYIFLHSALLEYAKRKGLLMETSDDESVDDDYGEENGEEDLDESEEIENTGEREDSTERDLIDVDGFEDKHQVAISVETPFSGTYELLEDNDTVLRESVHDPMQLPLDDSSSPLDASLSIVTSDKENISDLPLDNSVLPSVSNDLTLDLVLLPDSKSIDFDADAPKSSPSVTPGSTQEELVFTTDIVNVSQFSTCHTTMNTTTQSITADMAYSYADVASL